MKSQDLKKYTLPDTPGVYFFKAGREILYIGRATSLRERVRSYFGDDLLAERGARIVDMVTVSDDLEWKETPSVLEAIILEASLIKEHQPHANTDGKDDKTFNHVVITREDFPRLLVVRGKELQKLFPKGRAKYKFGPFPQGGLLQEALKIMRRIFPYRDGKCTSLKGKPCFNRQIGLCPGVCTGEISETEYARQIRRLVLFFQGKTASLERNLRREMKAAAALQRFEKAAELKRIIFGLEHIQDVALIKQEPRGEGAGMRRSFRIEAYDVAHLSGKHMVGAMVVAEGGVLKKSDYRIFNVRDFSDANDPGALKEIIRRRLKHSEWPTPDLVVVDGNEVQRRAADELFSPIPVVAVVKNDHHRPERFVGRKVIVKEHSRAIVLVNAEAHRFSLSRFRSRARRSLLLV